MFPKNQKITPRLNLGYLKLRLGLHALMLVLLCIAFVHSAIGQASLVKDINPGTGYSSINEYYNDSYNMTEANGFTFFFAQDATHGGELWRTDGTEAGTYLLKDIFPGTQSSYDDYYEARETAYVNGILFFEADDDSNGVELWVSDGTTTGTELIDLYPGGNTYTWGFYPYSSNPNNFYVGGNRVYFNASSPTGSELWTSDGTAAGTMMIEVYPDTNSSGYHYSSNPDNFFYHNGYLYFSAYNAEGRELWKSDGTQSGTMMVKDINPSVYSNGSPYSSNPSEFFSFNGELFFLASDSTHGVELWKTDGTEAGTQMVKDIRSGTFSGGLNGSDNWKVVNGTLYFRANDGTNGLELWKTDGTTAGTEMVKNINTGSGSSSPYDLQELNGKLVFMATDGSNGGEPWVSDGTDAGTFMLKDIRSGSSSSSIQYWFEYNGMLFFRAYDTTHGSELWKTDATTAGTELVKDINPGTNGSSLAHFTIANDLLFFVAQDTIGSSELWKTDGTTNGTAKVKEIYPGTRTSGSYTYVNSAAPSNLFEYEGLLYFAAQDTTNNYELWSSDGTESGTVKQELAPGGYTSGTNYYNHSSYPEQFVSSNGLVFFMAYVDTLGRELFKLGDPNMQFVVGIDSVEAGDTVILPIWVNRFDSIANYQGTITFDKDNLEFISISSPLANVSHTFGLPSQGNVPDSAITFTWYDPILGTTTLADSTVVMELKFVLDSNAAGGLIPVEIDGSSTSLGYSNSLTATSLDIPSVSNGGVEVDRSPKVQLATLVSSNADNTLATVGDTIILNFTTDKPVGVTPIVTIEKGGAAAVSVSGSGTSFTATKVVAAGDDGIVSFTVTVDDGTGFTSYMDSTTDGSSVIVDTELPTITCSGPINQNVDPGFCYATVSFPAPAGADNQTGFVVSQIAGLPSGSTFPVGTSSVSFAITDLAGNVDSCSFDIIVTDNELPTVLTQDITVYLDAAGVANITAADINNGSFDHCGIDTLTIDVSSFACGNVGANTVTLTANDIHGNSDFATANVTVLDTIAPTVLTQDLSLYLDAFGGVSLAASSIDAGSTDLCGVNTVVVDIDTFDCSNVGQNTVTLTVTDVHGNASSDTAVVTIIDNVVPVVQTQNIVLSLDLYGGASITPASIDDSSYDLCGIDTMYIDIDTFDCANVGPNTVTLTVEDIHGNMQSSTATVTIQDNPIISLSGAAISAMGDTIPGVVFDLSGDDGPLSQADSSFNFLTGACNASNDIGADKDDDASTNNGINVQDAFDIIQHIVLLQPLTSYNLIAADVNATNSINVLDAFQVLRKVANITTHFTDPVTGLDDATWTFIPSDHLITDPHNPFGFPTRRAYVSPSPLTGQDFIGVKLGDVNNSWDPYNLRPMTPNKSIKFVMDRLNAEPGQLVTIPVRVKDFVAITGYQYTLNWDPSVLQFESVTHQTLEGIYGTQDVENGNLTAAWIDLAGVAITLPDGENVFDLTFRVIGDMGSQTSFAMTSSITQSQAFAEDRSRLAVETEPNVLTVGSTTSVDPLEMQGYKLAQNYPNPFTSSTAIEFSLGQAEDLQVEIFTLTGKIVRSFEARYPAGNHSLEWDGNNASGAAVSQGIYLVRLKAGEYSSAIRVQKL
ncbi:MAG: ELWxxDGT repeat protein [Bacteroidota bacterium]